MKKHENKMPESVLPQAADKTVGRGLYKCRLACVGLSVVCLVVLAICLFAVETPNFPVCWFFAYTCLAGLIANAVLAMVELYRSTSKKRNEVHRS